MRLSAIQSFTMLDFPGKLACIAFTPGCNMRCGFCHNPEFVLPEKIAKLQGSFIDPETFFRFLQKRQGLLEGVVVSGGEPTLWIDLPDFLQEIKKRGFMVKLDTNGNHPEMLERLLQTELVDYVAMDVKASLDTYAQLVGPTVKPENIHRSIELLKEGKVEYEFRSTLIREVHTQPILEKMKELLRGSKTLYLQSFRPALTLDPRYQDYRPFSAQEMRALQSLFKKSVHQVFVREEGKN